ncbi:MAG TPA: tRNA (adenosine(37)-N6)-threonylcarbamoyltransferase complex transferase subunit TsaD [Candidatus Paceibacterota bacterium]|jgi:N6-L-threonylcarbamoyladenine synthase|nr:tRNA (adenosine(37)-N6)-threonylcarbamoyltransferase complex transferase subunit TsaD [Candidatus Paceibacterota bacterium]
MKILSIETSCDETGIAVLADTDQGAIALLGNALASQIELHAQYGGVFPAMAKRAHAQKIVALMKEALGQAGLLGTTLSASGTDARETILSICTREDEMVNDFVDLFNTYEKPDIDYIAVTVGPGLEPALWVGINAAKVLNAVWGIPIIAVNHMEGHVVTAAVVEKNGISSFQTAQHSHLSAGSTSQRTAREDQKNGNIVPSASEIQKTYEFRELQFPLLALLVSGGHTELVLTDSYGDYKKIGQTRDDAVGEAFDKVARMLGLPYPGGPAVSRLAKEFRTTGKSQQFEMPRPMIHSGDYDFSFSGIKTAMLYTIRDLGHEVTDDEKMALACAFEDAVVDVIIKKTLRAAEEFHIQTIVVGGGVAGNSFLREQLSLAVQNKLSGVTVLFPEPWLATDNAVMIGLAAFARGMTGTISTTPASDLKANGNLSIETE